MRRWEDASKVSDRRAEFDECIDVLNDWIAFKRRVLIWKIRLGLWLVAVFLSIWVLVRIGSSSTM